MYNHFTFLTVTSHPWEKWCMKILILGGTVFLGRALVESALNSGHEVTLFNRGKTNPGLFPGVEEIHGDRKESLDSLAGRTWDAAIDTSGYFPKM
jgi:2'-hydroxyisoflavone reductase